MVSILTPGLFKRPSVAYNVVDFPLPVGPVTNIIPVELPIASCQPSRVFFEKPNLSRDICPLLGSKMRITVFSPNSVG